MMPIEYQIEDEDYFKAVDNTTHSSGNPSRHGEAVALVLQVVVRNTGELGRVSPRLTSCGGADRPAF